MRKFARQLMTSTLYQYVARVCEPILNNERPDPSWRQRRTVVDATVERRLLEVDDTFGDCLDFDCSFGNVSRR